MYSITEKFYTNAFNIYFSQNIMPEVHQTLKSLLLHIPRCHKLLKHSHHPPLSQPPHPSINILYTHIVEQYASTLPQHTVNKTTTSECFVGVFGFQWEGFYSNQCTDVGHFPLMNGGMMIWSYILMHIVWKPNLQYHSCMYINNTML